MPIDTFRSQRRGGKGVAGMTVKDTDEVSLLTAANTHDSLLVFTSKGKVFSLKTWELPEGSRISKGQAIINLINIDTDETIQSLLPVSKEVFASKSFLFFTTQKGTVKRTKLGDYQNIRNNGLIAIKLEAGDRLVWVNKTAGTDHLLLVTKQGKSIRFPESDVRPTGRDTMGVRGILLATGDYVVAMKSFDPETISGDKKKKIFTDLLIVTEKGMGKRTPLTQYPTQKRGGQGVKVAEIAAKPGHCQHPSLPKRHRVLITTKKAGDQTPHQEHPQLQRSTQGVILMRFAKAGDTVAAVAAVRTEAKKM